MSVSKRTDPMLHPIALVGRFQDMKPPMDRISGCEKTVWEIEAVASPAPELLPATLNWMGPLLLYRKAAAEGKPGSAVKVEAGVSGSQSSWNPIRRHSHQRHIHNHRF